jgi:hypothetical protein
VPFLMVNSALFMRNHLILSEIRTEEERQRET